MNATNNLNMIPKDPGTILSSDMTMSLLENPGDLYALSLQSMAINQSPIYGSGGGRWFFHNPADPQAANKPLLDLSSVFQGGMNLVTGQLTGGGTFTATLSNAYITPLQLRYNDWHGEPSTGTQFIDFAGQAPTTVASDSDRQLRLASALTLKKPRVSIAGSGDATCAIYGAGGQVKCWGNADLGELGNGNTNFNNPQLKGDFVPGLSGVVALNAGDDTFCALLSNSTVKYWGFSNDGETGDGKANLLEPYPVLVSGLTNAIDIAHQSGGLHSCAITKANKVRGQAAVLGTEPRRSTRQQFDGRRLPSRYRPRVAE